MTRIVRRVLWRAKVANKLGITAGIEATLREGAAVARAINTHENYGSLALAFPNKIPALMVAGQPLRYRGYFAEKLAELARDTTPDWRPTETLPEDHYAL